MEEEYLDGLKQLKIIKDVDNDKFVINNKFYKSALKHLKEIYKKYPDESEFNIFNYALLHELSIRLGMINDEELYNYSGLLIKILGISGIYKDLFGDNWEENIKGA